jgi:competence protein ComEC
VKVVRRHHGETFEFGGSRIQVLAPPEGWVVGPQPHNNDSLVIRVAYKNTAAVLPGDAENKIERFIAAQSAPSDLLKVAHNGSNTSTSSELLQAIRPRFALISVGARNPYGHPRREVLARLQNSGVLTYRTDLHGAVTFYLEGDTVTPSLR